MSNPTIGLAAHAGRVDIRIAAKAAGSNAYYYHHLGVVQYQLKNYDEAIKQFEKALSNDSELADSRFYMGECYLKLGDDEQAVKEFEATLELDPNYLSARAKLIILNAQKKIEG